MRRRHAEIEGDAVDDGNTGLGECLVEFTEATDDEAQARAELSQQRTVAALRLGVAIERHDLTGGGLEDRPRVAAIAEGGIHIEAAIARRQQRHGFRQHHGDVRCGHHTDFSSCGLSFSVAPRARARSRVLLRSAACLSGLQI